MLKSVIRLALLTIIAVGAGEAIARYGLGLGTPPLSVTHPRIEYMFAPNQDASRFGNRQLYNEYSMRNKPLSEWGDHRRVLVFGDSVLNGGNLTDHQSLATTLATLRAGDTVYGNISAGSWGPDNILGWIDTFGLLDADTVIFVMSSHDIGDAPRFRALNPDTHPTELPTSALGEAIKRYLPRYLPLDFLNQAANKAEPIATTHTGRGGAIVVPDLLAVLGRSETRSCVVLHATLSETQSGDNLGLEALSRLFEIANVPVLRLSDFENGDDITSIYRDSIHLNDAGQRVLRSALEECDSIARVPSEYDE